MTTVSSATRRLSRSLGNPPQCLLRSSKTSSALPARNCSTSALKHPTSVSRYPPNPQSLSSKGVRLSTGPVVSSFRGEPLIKARRRFSASTVALHNELVPPKPGEELHITFIDKEGDEHTFDVAKGDNLLDIAQENDVEMEGACGGSCACSTCHVIVEDEEMYNKMDEPDDDENDMLDLAFGLTETSRLGCQVKMSKELDGLRVKLPSMTRNLQASDFSRKNERSD